MQTRMTVLSWASKVETLVVGARQVFASLEMGVHEMRIDWWVVEGELVSCTEALEFLAVGKRHCKADTALDGVGGSNVDAK